MLRSKDPSAIAEVAVQFEALFIGMMLKTARDASMGEGLFDGQETRQYLDLMDSQVALELARKGGFGFGRMIVEQLAKGEAPADGKAGFDLRDVLRGPIDLAGSARSPVPGAPAASGPRDPAQEFPRGLPPSLRTLSPGASGEAAAAQSNDAVPAARAALAGSAEDFVTRVSRRGDGGGESARRRAALAARAGRARDGLGRRDGPAPRRAAREQPVRHQGRARAGAARVSRNGRSSTATGSRLASAKSSAPTAHRGELRGLRESDFRHAALCRGARARP